MFVNTLEALSVGRGKSKRKLLTGDRDEARRHFITVAGKVRQHGGHRENAMRGLSEDAIFVAALFERNE
jgi:hypothetical protein